MHHQGDWENWLLHLERGQGDWKHNLGDDPAFNPPRHVEFGQGDERQGEMQAEIAHNILMVQIQADMDLQLEVEMFVEREEMRRHWCFFAIVFRFIFFSLFVKSIVYWRLEGYAALFFFYILIFTYALDVVYNEIIR